MRLFWCLPPHREFGNPVTTMNKNDLLACVFASSIFREWHWFRFHFNHHLYENGHPFSESILRACLDCEPHLPGFSKGMIEGLATLCGREKHWQHLEQLFQRLAELLVIRQIVTYDWPFPARFVWEPTAAGSKKNPEILIEGGPEVIGVEVKAPALQEHQKKRGKNPTQVPSRVFGSDELASLPNVENGLTLPRDNPVKDFLVSADAKFASFKAADPTFRGILVIVWDDHIFEPITSLIHESSGLFTPNSFAKDKQGNRLRFQNVDSVVMIRHLHQFSRASAEKPLCDSCREALDYGRDGEFPPKAFIDNPDAAGAPKSLLECLQAYAPTSAMGAEYTPKDLIWWFGGESDSPEGEPGAG